LAPFKAIAPDIEYSLVSSTAPSASTAKAVGDTVNVKWTALNKSIVDSYHAKGVKVHAWTLDDPKQWAAAESLGVDRIVTNKPVAYRGWREYRCNRQYWR